MAGVSGLSGSAAQVYSFFRQRYGPIVAAGIVGNTQQESSNNAADAGGGLIQGQGGRTSSGSLSQQLAGVVRELEGPERGTLAALRAAKSPREAALIFSQRFERPGEPRNDLRVRYAEEAAKQFGHGAALPSAGAPAGGQVTPGQMSVSGGPSAGSGDQQALLAQVLAALQPKPQPLQIGSPARPATAAGPILPNGSHPPAPLTPVPAQDNSTARLLEAALSSSSGGEEAHITSTAPTYAPAAAAVHAGGPLAGLLPKGAMLKLGRIDAGQDGQTNPGGAIVANGNGEIVDIKSDPSGFGPRYPVVVFHSGPLAGHGPIYLGHTLAALGKGAQFHQGTILSHTGTSGVGNATVPGWFEIGYASALGQGNQGQGRSIAPLLSRPR